MTQAGDQVSISKMLPTTTIELIKRKRRDGESLRAIAEQLRISTSTVHYAVRNNYSKQKKKRGPRKKLDKAAELRMKRQVSKMIETNCKVTSRKIQDECDLNASLRTVQRSLKDLGFKYRKASKNINLSSQHKAQRVHACKEWLRTRLDWNKVVYR